MTTTNPHAPWLDRIAAFSVRLDAMERQFAALMRSRPRWLLRTPNLTVGLRRRWKPWWSVRHCRNGHAHVGFGLLLVAVSVVVPRRAS